MSSTVSVFSDRLNIEIERGATLRIPLTWKDEAGAIVPCSGLDAWIHFRSQVNEETILFQMTSANGRIILADTAPNITLYISDEDTTTITTWDEAVADFLIEMSNSDRNRLFDIYAVVTPGVTRDV